MSIRTEFEKARRDAYPKYPNIWTPDESALWAAKWMAERCAKQADEKYLDANAADTQSECDRGMSTASYEIASEIRQLAKELE